MAKRKSARPAPAAKTLYAAPALEKGFDIIELLAAAPDGLTSSEIAQRLGRSLSEIFRILVVMERRAWLRKSADRYSVSYRVLEHAFRATPAQSSSSARSDKLYPRAAFSIPASSSACFRLPHSFWRFRSDIPAIRNSSRRLGPLPSFRAHSRIAFTISSLVTATSQKKPPIFGWLVEFEFCQLLCGTGRVP